MARFSASQIYAFALEAGFDRDSAATMTAIALAESSGQGAAHATRGEDSRGLWQINAHAHPDLAARFDLFDPQQNALAAYAVSRQGEDISPWTSTHGGARAAYSRYREVAQAAAVAHGGRPGLGVWSGSTGYSHPQAAGASAGPADAAASASTESAVQVSGNPFEAALSPPDNPFEVTRPSGGNSFEAVPSAAAGHHSTPQSFHGPRIVDSFVDTALDQTGDRYVFGADVHENDPNPSAFDCAELVRWSAHRNGIDLPAGSWLQFLDLKRHGLLIPVGRGIDTRGALLFSFSSEPEPGAPRPYHSHVAISLGNGHTIEARGRAYGVGSFDATTTRFDYAALLPGAQASTGMPETGPDTAVEAAPAPLLDTDDAPDPPDILPVRADWHTAVDPFVVDSSPQGLADSLELLYGDVDLAPDSGAGAVDPLDLAVAAVLDSVPITPFDGYEPEGGDRIPAAAASAAHQDPVHDVAADPPSTHSPDGPTWAHDAQHHYPPDPFETGPDHDVPLEPGHA